MVSLSGLLPSLYATAQDASRWVDTLDRLCELAGTRNAAMQILERQGDHLRPVVDARDSYSLANAELHDRYVNNDANPRFDLRYDAMVPSAAGPIVRYGDALCDIDPEFAQLRARLASIGLGSAICVTFEMQPDRIFSLILHRSAEDQRDFDEADEAMLNEMLPHLRQTTELSTSLREARSSVRLLQGAIDAVRLGVVLCDAEGCVRWLNQSAEAIIALTPLVRIWNGRLTATAPSLQKAFRHLLAAMPEDAVSPILALEQDGDMLQVRAVPLDMADGEPGLRAVFLSDSTAALEISPEDVARLFSLSPAEARLAAAIAGGASVTGYSVARGISVGTARIQLKQVLAKTQAGKQSDLTRQLCRSVLAQTVARSH